MRDVMLFATLRAGVLLRAAGARAEALLLASLSAACGLPVSASSFSGPAVLAAPEPVLCFTTMACLRASAFSPAACTHGVAMVGTRSLSSLHNLANTGMRRGNQIVRSNKREGVDMNWPQKSACDARPVLRPCRTCQCHCKWVNKQCIIFLRLCGTRSGDHPGRVSNLICMSASSDKSV